MNQQQYRQFLNDPRTLLNGTGNVRQIRLTGFGATDNAVSRAVVEGGVLSLRYRFSAARVTPVSLRYDDTHIPATSAIWVSGGTPPPPPAVIQRDRAYYLQWGVDQAYAIELGADAQLFFTAELTGCGILVLSAPDKLIVVHHNVQVPDVRQNFMQRLFERNQSYRQRSDNNAIDVREQTLHNLAQDLIATTPGITGGTQLSVAQYASPSRVFGIKRGGQWRLFINSPVGGNFQTQLLYG